MYKQQTAAYYILQLDLVLCKSFILPARERLSNISLTLNALNWRDSCTTLRCSSCFTDSRKKRDNSVIGSKQVLG